jgi:high-affinity nickel-transport protein
MFGMTRADGANGLWIASLLRSADGRARIASRVLGLAVAGLSLGVVAAFVIAGRDAAPVAAWASGRKLALGVGVIGVVAAASVLCFTLARWPAVAPRT